MYEYIVGIVPFLAIWAAVFWRSEHLRAKMLYSSLICMPFGALDILFIPEYWHPPSIFGLVPPLESFAFAFLFGGIASSTYESVRGKKVVDIPDDERASFYRFETRTYEKWTIVLGGIPLLFWGFDLKIMTTSLILLFVLGAIELVQRPDLVRKTLFSSLFLAAVYTATLLFLKTAFFPAMFQDWWTHQNLLGVYIAGVPVEEIVFAFVFGLLFSPYYEVSTGKKLVDA